MIIANPIYNEAFDSLIKDERAARFLLKCYLMKS